MLHDPLLFQECNLKVLFSRATLANDVKVDGWVSFAGGVWYAHSWIEHSGVSHCDPKIFSFFAMWIMHSAYNGSKLQNMRVIPRSFALRRCHFGCRVRDKRMLNTHLSQSRGFFLLLHPSLQLSCGQLFTRLRITDTWLLLTDTVLANTRFDVVASISGTSFRLEVEEA